MRDIKWLATQIVRMGERYPDRVGLRMRAKTANCSDHCIMGQIIHDHGGCGGLFTDIWGVPGNATDYIDLLRSTIKLNNDGVRWGEIPLRLGLIPGEMETIECVKTDTVDGASQESVLAGNVKETTESCVVENAITPGDAVEQELATV